MFFKTSLNIFLFLFTTNIFLVVGRETAHGRIKHDYKVNNFINILKYYLVYCKNVYVYIYVSVYIQSFRNDLLSRHSVTTVNKITLNNLRPIYYNDSVSNVTIY